MYYDAVQTSLEAYIKASWANARIHFDNVSFVTTNVTDYISHSVRFGDARARTVAKGCYRQLGLIIITCFTKPADGSLHVKLAETAAELYRHKLITPISPHVAPKVRCHVPDLFVNNKENLGWVYAQVSTPFHYDFTKE